MKKLMMVIAALMLSVISYCQSIDIGQKPKLENGCILEHDAFTHKSVVKSFTAQLTKMKVFGTTPGFDMQIVSRDINTICIVVTGMSQTDMVLGTGSHLIFLLSDDSTVSVESTGVQSTSYLSDGIYTINFTYSLDTTDVRKLSYHPTKSLRIYASDGYRDYTCLANNGLDLCCRNFLREYSNIYQLK